MLVKFTKDKMPPKVRLSIDMDAKMHQDLKIISAKRNCSMRKLVIRALIALVRHENKYN